MPHPFCNNNAPDRQSSRNIKQCFQESALAYVYVLQNGLLTRHLASERKSCLPNFAKLAFKKFTALNPFATSSYNNSVHKHKI